MSAAIARENQANRQAAKEYPGQRVRTNRQLARVLGIEMPPYQYYQDYDLSDIEVTVI